MINPWVFPSTALKLPRRDVPDGAALIRPTVCCIGRIWHLCRHPAQARGMFSDTALCIFQRGIHGLMAAGGVDHSRTYRIPEADICVNIRHDLAFLGVIHGGSDTGSFANRVPERFQRHGAPAVYSCSPPPDPDRSQVSLFEELFASSLFGLAALNPRAQHADERFRGFTLKVGSRVTP